MSKLIFDEVAIVAIFALILYAINTENMELLYYAIAMICTILGTLLGMWKIISHMEEKRDKEIKQLLKSEQEFKDHKESTSHSFMAFSKQVYSMESKLNSTLERIDKKLDRQDEIIAKQESTIARIDERTKDK